MGVVEVKDVSRTYKMGDEKLAALDHVSVTVNAGDFVAITGPSGSGKSTLANIIGGLDRPDTGSVVVDGKDIAKISDRQLSKYRNSTLGFVFQSFNLLAKETALENVMRPLVFAGVKPKERKRRAEEALEAVGLANRSKHRPTQLSGGQRQRIAIARAIVNSPTMVVADEPTGNLDTERGIEIMNLLKKLNADGITLMVITHNDDIANDAGRILHISDGRLSEVK